MTSFKKHFFKACDEIFNAFNFYREIWSCCSVNPPLAVNSNFVVFVTISKIERTEQTYAVWHLLTNHLNRLYYSSSQAQGMTLM